MARFEAHLAAELDAGKLRKPTVRNYLGAVGRLVAWLGPEPVADVASLRAVTDRYVEGVKAGELPCRTDKVYARPAFRRLLELSRPAD
ncbi:MAG: hypothetical protein R3F59_11730 [Myxococcota bacterium]